MRIWRGKINPAKIIYLHKLYTMDNMWDRMKWYESVSDMRLTKRVPVIIRIDWRAFHTFTRKCKKPFDQNIIDAFVLATEKISKDIMWFKIAYTQSDEVSILITDYDTIQSESFFGYRISKINSVVASMFTNYFNEIYVWDDNAVFDCRCFNIPESDIANYFLWRQKDWEKNSIQMYARSMYTTKELYKKKLSDLHDMLYQKWCNWATLDEQLKNWSYITKKWNRYIRPDFQCVSDLLDKVFADSMNCEK